VLDRNAVPLTFNYCAWGLSDLASSWRISWGCIL